MTFAKLIVRFEAIFYCHAAIKHSFSSFHLLICSFSMLAFEQGHLSLAIDRLYYYRKLPIVHVYPIPILQ